MWTGEAKRIAEKPRDGNANKGKYGHVLVVGGNYGTSGAPSMASLAALRTGAGLVTAAVPKSIVDAVAGIAPELMMAPMKESAEGEIAITKSDFHLAFDYQKCLVSFRMAMPYELAPYLHELELIVVHFRNHSR